MKVLWDMKMKSSQSFELQIMYIFLKYMSTVQLHDKIIHLAKKSPNIAKLKYQLPCLQ